MGPCVAKPGKFVCIGLNYHDHAVETGLTPPSEPVVFMKAVSAIGGLTTTSYADEGVMQE